MSVSKIDTPSLTNDQIIWQIAIWFYTRILCITDYFSDTSLVDLKDIPFPDTLNTLDLDKYYYDLNSYAAIDEYIQRVLVKRQTATDICCLLTPPTHELDIYKYTKNHEVSPHISEGSLVGLAIFFYLHAKLSHSIVFCPSESFRKKNVFLVEEESTVYYIKYGDDATYDSIRNMVLDLSKKHKICQYKILTLDKQFKKTKMFRRFVFDSFALKELNRMTKHLEE